MGFFRKSKPVLDVPFDPAKQQPAVRRSICTGEMTLGFVDRKTGKFLDYALARDQKELERFCAATGVTPEKLRTIY